MQPISYSCKQSKYYDVTKCRRSKLIMFRWLDSKVLPLSRGTQKVLSGHSPPSTNYGQVGWSAGDSEIAYQYFFVIPPLGWCSFHELLSRPTVVYIKQTWHKDTLLKWANIMLEWLSIHFLNIKQRGGELMFISSFYSCKLVRLGISITGKIMLGIRDSWLKNYRDKG